MKTIHFTSASVGLFLTLFLCVFLIFPGSAVYVIANPNDPYTDTCVFDAAPGEPILYLTDYNGQGGMKSYRISDQKIGAYIQERYPDIWEQLSPEDQELYNTRAAVYEAGADEPTLPDKVIALLALSKIPAFRPALQERQMTGISPPLKPVLPTIGRSLPIDSSSPGAVFDARTPDVINGPETTRMRIISTPAISNFRLQEVQSGASLGALFDARTSGVTTLPKLTRPF